MDAGTEHAGALRHQITIEAYREDIWKRLCAITRLEWVSGVKEARFVTKKQNCPGAVREILFSDGSTVTEHVVEWRDGESFSYIATDGLPVRAYYATILVDELYKKRCTVTWKSYFVAAGSRQEFVSLEQSLRALYVSSLLKLKEMTEEVA